MSFFNTEDADAIEVEQDGLLLRDLLLKTQLNR
jgi:hypothetical protein